MLTLLSSIFSCLLFALALSVDSGYSYGAVLLLLCVLLGMPFWWRHKQLNQAVILLILSFLLMGAVSAFDAWRSDFSSSAYGLPIRFLLFPLVLLFFTAKPPGIQFIWWSVAIGAISSGLSAAYYEWVNPSLVAEYGRASRYMNPIQFGNLSILFSIFCLCGFLSILKGGCKILMLALALGFLFGALASVLSQSRGGWFALSVTIIVMIAILIKRFGFSARIALFVLMISASCLLLFYFTTLEIVLDRFLFTYQNLYGYFVNGNINTSVGLRLEMWRFGWHEGLRFPWFGAGTAQMIADKSQWLSDGKIASYAHLHNEYIDAFAKKGLLGLVAVLLLFGSSVYVFARPIFSSATLSNEQYGVLLAGLANGLMHSLFGLTQVSVNAHNSGFMLFMFPLCIFYGCYLAAKKAESA